MHSDDLLTYHMSELTVQASPTDSALQTSATAPSNAISHRLRHTFASHTLSLSSSPRPCLNLHTYSRTMAAHTQWQLDSPAISSVPSYAKTMHSFTLELLLRHQGGRRKSECGEARQSMLPSLVQARLGRVMIDEVPVPPCPSPVDGQGVARSEVRGRSTTQPVPRDFAVAARERGTVV